MDATLSLMLLFASTCVAAGALASLALSHTRSGRRGLKRLVETPASRVSGGAPDLIIDRPPQALDRLARSVGWTAERIWTVDRARGSRADQQDSASRAGAGKARIARARHDLISAGYRSAAAAQMFLVARVALPLVLVTGVLLAGGGITSAAVVAPLGLVSAELFLRRSIRQRQKAVRSGLPDAIDLFVICLEAGSTLEQALVKTADELALAHSVLADELRLVRAEMQTGKSKAEAFRRLAERVRLEEVRSLVAILVQTDRFGTSVVQALRTHAVSLRMRRRQRAEERAAKAGIKLVFPLVFCFFPAFYVIALGPMIVQFIHLFFETMVTQLR
jgi:tight adherence protein C